MITLTEETRKTLESLEEELWTAQTRYDLQRMGELFADDFFEFGRSGRVYGRSELLMDSGMR